MIVTGLLRLSLLWGGLSLLVAMTLVMVGMLSGRWMKAHAPVLAFAASADPARDFEIYLLDIERGLLHHVTQSHALYSLSPSWSPDGRELVFSGSDARGTHIYRIAASGRDLRQLSEGPGVHSDPGFSPDGQRIVFVSNRFGGGEILSMDRDGGSIERLTRRRPEDYGPVWSPSGAHIAYIAMGEGNISPELWMIDADGRQPRRLTFEPINRSINGATWSPDSSQIAFQVFRREGFRIYRLTVPDPTLPGRPDPPEPVAGFDFPAEWPAWLPDGSGLAAVVNSRAFTQATGVYLSDLDGQPAHLIYHHPDWLSLSGLAWRP